MLRGLGILVAIVLGVAVIFLIGAGCLLWLGSGPIGGIPFWERMGPGMMGWGGLWGWWMFIPALFVLLVIGGGLALIVWLASQGLSRASIPPTGRDAALEALRLRYARGEITKEQFDQIRADLEKD